MLTISAILALAALIIAILSAVKSYPIIWVAVVLLSIIELLQFIPK